MIILVELDELLIDNTRVAEHIGLNQLDKLS